MQILPWKALLSRGRRQPCVPSSTRIELNCIDFVFLLENGARGCAQLCPSHMSMMMVVVVVVVVVMRMMMLTMMVVVMAMMI